MLLHGFGYSSFIALKCDYQLVHIQLFGTFILDYKESKTIKPVSLGC